MTTRHRDCLSTSEFFQPLSAGEPRRQEYNSYRAAPPQRDDHDPYVPPPRSSSRGQLELLREIEDARAVVEMRAILNSRGCLTLGEIDSREVLSWEKARSRDRLV